MTQKDETPQELRQRLIQEHGTAQVEHWISIGRDRKGYDGAALVSFVAACARNGWYSL